MIRTASANPKIDRTFRMEDYLQAIHSLVETKGYAASVQISELLGVSAPSVTKMLKRLRRTGYIEYERYRGVSLTRQGRMVAAGMSRRRRILVDFFQSIGVEGFIASKDAEAIEHHLSETTLVKLEELMQKLAAD